jgi:hypothetical protein
MKQSHPIQPPVCSPARDLFTAAAAAPVTSVVVVPLVGPDDAAVGALYFTQSCACDFANIQDALLVSHRAPIRAGGACLDAPQPLRLWGILASVWDPRPALMHHWASINTTALASGPCAFPYVLSSPLCACKPAAAGRLT